jgi:Kef-type K+ transport system membrane component KefB
VSEPEVKFIFLVLFGLGGLASASKSEAVLPAYLLGLVAAGAFRRNPRLLGRIRGSAFSFLTPFFFLRAGTLVVVQAVLAGIVSTVMLFAVKMVAKFVGVYPATLAFRIRGKQAVYTTMMMSTGLTFGTISALFGLHPRLHQSIAILRIGHCGRDDCTCPNVDWAILLLSERAPSRVGCGETTRRA